LTMEDLKKRLVERLIDCDDPKILKKVSKALNVEVDIQEVREDEEIYTKIESKLTEEQWREVDRRSKDIKDGKAILIPWEQVRKNLRKKYGV